MALSPEVVQTERVLVSESLGQHLIFVGFAFLCFNFSSCFPSWESARSASVGSTARGTVCFVDAQSKSRLLVLCPRP